MQICRRMSHLLTMTHAFTLQVILTMISVVAYSDIIYNKGQNIVQYNRIDKRQRIIQMSEKSETYDLITAYSSGYGKRFYLDYSINMNQI
jgi:hypothetical protein